MTPTEGLNMLRDFCYLLILCGAVALAGIGWVLHKRRKG